MTGTNEALALTFVMGAVILFCRAFPFLFFREPPAEGAGSRRAAFLNFVEKIVPPAAMTVLAFNSLAGPLKGNLREAIPVLSAACFTALVHLWKRNPLISIFGGTALYMVLERIVVR
ncbi:MAG: AzlD domain-containing protein [Treponema sp.]|jgi:branched-subunit amino acid transport protein AzlD|nr:AzlD domain-containing protein [Treponema sp.]